MVIAAELILARRLTLLPLRAAHADEMAVVLSDPGLHTFIGGVPLTAQALRTRYERLAAGSPDPGVSWCNWVLRLRDPGCLTGTVQATISAGGSAAEIAWVVGAPWQRQGLATEAAVALVGWLRRRSVGTVVAHIHPDHRASAGVARAAGLRPTEHVHEGETRWEVTFSGRQADPEGGG